VQQVPHLQHTARINAAATLLQCVAAGYEASHSFRSVVHMSQDIPDAVLFPHDSTTLDLGCDCELPCACIFSAPGAETPDAEQSCASACNCPTKDSCSTQGNCCWAAALGGARCVVASSVNYKSDPYNCGTCGNVSDSCLTGVQPQQLTTPSSCHTAAWGT
jgi:hypothetical protein